MLVSSLADIPAVGSENWQNSAFPVCTRSGKAKLRQFFICNGRLKTFSIFEIPVLRRFLSPDVAMFVGV